MSDWRDLLKAALPALDEAYGADLDSSDPSWTVGGGAAIALAIDHRETRDVDIFLQRGLLKHLSPNRNAAAARISANYQWPGHYLKFEREDGEIDFLSAPLQTERGCSTMTIDGRDVAFETPEEVVVKKMRFRTATFTARDVFDLAAVAAARPCLAAILAEEVPDTLERIREAIRVHRSRGREALERLISPTPAGRALLPRVFDLADEVVGEAARIAAGRGAATKAAGGADPLTDLIKGGPAPPSASGPVKARER